MEHLYQPWRCLVSRICHKLFVQIARSFSKAGSQLERQATELFDHIFIEFLITSSFRSSCHPHSSTSHETVSLVYSFTLNHRYFHRSMELDQTLSILSADCYYNMSDYFQRSQPTEVLTVSRFICL